MKKTISMLAIALVSVMFIGCSGVDDGEYKVAGFMGAETIKIDGNTLSSGRYSIEVEEMSIEKNGDKEYLVAKHKDGKIDKYKIVSKPE